VKPEEKKEERRKKKEDRRQEAGERGRKPVYAGFFYAGFYTPNLSGFTQDLNK